VQHSHFKIVHVIGLRGIGGVQKNFCEYIDTIDNQSKNHTVVTWGEVDDQYSNLQIEVINAKKIIGFLKLILYLISSKRIVHFYNNFFSIKVLALLFLIPVNKVIIHERGAAWNAKKNIFLSFLYRKISIFIANSNASKILLSQKFSVPASKIRVIHNGINTTLPKISRKKIQSYKQIGFIGRFDLAKGLETLLDSFMILTKEYKKEIRLLVAGDGRLKKCLKEKFTSDKIKFIGRVHDTSEFYNNIDILVVPSIREPLGNVCLEAGLHKTPVIASYIDGIPEIIENMKSGILIEPTIEPVFKCVDADLPLPEVVFSAKNSVLAKPKKISLSKLNNKIVTLLENTDLANKLAKNLQIKVLDYFNIDRYAIEIEDIYKEIYNEDK